MTDQQRSDIIAEQFVQEVAERVAAPRAGESLLGYLARLVEEFGCDGGLRWSTRWRDAQPQPDRGLLARLRSGGGYCDCEVMMNVYDRFPDEDVLPHGCPEQS